MEDLDTGACSVSVTIISEATPYDDDNNILQQHGFGQHSCPAAMVVGHAAAAVAVGGTANTNNNANARAMQTQSNLLALRTIIEKDSAALLRGQLRFQGIIVEEGIPKSEQSSESTIRIPVYVGKKIQRHTQSIVVSKQRRV
jgi:hypothetical protein